MHPMHAALKKHLGLARLKEGSPKEEALETPDEESKEQKMGLGDKAPDLNEGPSSPMGHKMNMTDLTDEHLPMIAMLMKDGGNHPGRGAMTLDEKAHEKMASIMKHRKAKY